MHSRDLEGDRALRMLWGLEARGTRGPKPRASLAEVAEAGIRLADEVGLDGVSLAGVAAELGLTTTALYRYVDTKEGLVEVMVDAAIGSPPELTGDDWRGRARVWAVSLASRYWRHPWLSTVRPAGVPVRPGVYAWLDALLAAVEDAPEVDGMRLGLVLDAVVRSLGAFGAPGRPPSWLGDAIARRHPRLAAELGRDWGDVEAELVGAIALVLRGAS